MLVVTDLCESDIPYEFTLTVTDIKGDFSTDVIEINIDPEDNDVFAQADIAIDV